MQVKKGQVCRDGVDLSSSPAASSSSSVEDSALSSASSLVIANLRPMEDLKSIILWSSQIIK